MLAASDDLIDLLHEHPFNADNGQIEFDLTFPRAATYRVWIQFQREGVVNTVAFNVPVQASATVTPGTEATIFVPAGSSKRFAEIIRPGEFRIVAIKPDQRLDRSVGTFGDHAD